jgi:hypothetical protein
LAYAIDFWSKGAMKAHFCRHEGYLGRNCRCDIVYFGMNKLCLDMRIYFWPIFSVISNGKSLW